jgi:sigma-E factor negative regulatory protein RseC
MIETSALVIRTEGPDAWVETHKEGSCAACGTGSCDAAAFSDLFHRRPRQYRARNAIGVRAGDRVVVGLRDGALLRSAAAIYGLPLLLLLSGAVLGDWFSPASSVRDFWSVLGALAALLVGSIWIIWFTRKSSKEDRYQPVILRREDKDIVVMECKSS